MKPGYLLLENQAVFPGYCPDWQQNAFLGEVVFTTGMTGYFESLTDPSYAGQILVFTFPLIGNYGVSGPDTWESKKIHARGVVVSESCLNWSHHAGLVSFLEWLKVQQVPLITGVDTRALTKLLRTSGTLLGAISENQHPINFKDPNLEDLVAQVSAEGSRSSGKGSKKIIVVDCGMKESMMRFLSKYPLQIQRVPYNFDYSEMEYDGIFLSNGPGDPMQCSQTITILRKAMAREKPIFGVCLGSQMMALAAGARTYKLRFGHRGQNQPCMELTSGKCFITSQHHGYAVDETSLSSEWKVTFKNLNDGSVEGISHTHLPFFSVQFHPEACPGPTDTRWLFERFYQCL